mgnify:CR=1 FL=1
MNIKRKKYHHGDLRNALIQAGIEILEEDGLQGLTMRAIAARVGVSHTAPKNHFGSLKGLMTAIGAEGFRRHAIAMRQGLSDTSHGKDRLDAAMRGYLNFAEAHPALFQLMFSPYYCDFGEEEFSNRARESYAILTEISRDLDWDKANLPDSQLRTEMMLWSFAHGFATLKVSRQFPNDETGKTLDIDQVIPSFDYLDKG